MSDSWVAPDRKIPSSLMAYSMGHWWHINAFNYYCNSSLLHSHNSLPQTYSTCFNGVFIYTVFNWGIVSRKTYISQLLTLYYTFLYSYEILVSNYNILNSQWRRCEKGCLIIVDMIYAVRYVMMVQREWYCSSQRAMFMTLVHRRYTKQVYTRLLWVITSLQVALPVWQTEIVYVTANWICL